MFRNRKLAVVVVALAAVILLAVSSAAQSPEQLLQAMRWRNVGPAVFAGRVVDVEALDNDFRYVITASASGGVWKSTNAGTTWTPIFDQYKSASIGDVAIFQKNPNIIWVGTGEANNRNSVAWGDGIYKSTDGGKTFARSGLADSDASDGCKHCVCGGDWRVVGAIRGSRFIQDGGWRQDMDETNERPARHEGRRGEIGRD